MREYVRSCKARPVGDFYSQKALAVFAAEYLPRLHRLLVNSISVHHNQFIIIPQEKHMHTQAAHLSDSNILNRRRDTHTEREREKW